MDNYNNDTDDGLHITAMTGGWLAIVHGFAGMRVSDAGELSYKPFLPKKWESYSFRQVFRDRIIEITVDQGGAHVQLIEGDPLSIMVNGERQVLENK